METIQLGKGDISFIRKVESASGSEVNKCYQCGNCTAGCPMSFTYDYTVSQLMRLIQLGQAETVLSSQAIWMCATCEACTTHCPNNINVAQVLDACRNMAHAQGRKGVRNVRLFVESFLQSVRWNGKSHELGLMAMYKMRSGRLFDDVTLAPGMLCRGKLAVLPHRASAEGRKEVAGIFKRFAKRQARQQAEKTGGDK